MIDDSWLSCICCDETSALPIIQANSSTRTHGEIDIIITSPPIGGGMGGSSMDSRGGHKWSLLFFYLKYLIPVLH